MAQRTSRAALFLFRFPVLREWLHKVSAPWQEVGPHKLSLSDGLGSPTPAVGWCPNGCAITFGRARFYTEQPCPTCGAELTI